MAGPGRLPGAGGEARRGPMVNGHAPGTFASSSGNGQKKVKMSIQCTVTGLKTS